MEGNERSKWYSFREELEAQNYVSRFLPNRYSGNGFMYHSEVAKAMFDSARMSAECLNKILDVGCGVGFISSLYPNLDITGIDISPETLALNPFKHVLASAQRIPFNDNYFDLVVCRGLLHHLEEPAIGIKEMNRVLKRKGRFVCWEPNASPLNDLIRKLTQKPDRFSRWHKSFKFRELIQILKNGHFHIDEITYQGHFAYPLLGFPDIFDFHIPKKLARLLIKIDGWISCTSFKKLSWAIMIKAHKE